MMGLMIFHKLLILVGIAFTGFFTYWQYGTYQLSKENQDLYILIVSFVFFIALLAYFFIAINKYSKKRYDED